MFNVVIVDDEKPILELMKVVIGRNPNYSIAGAFMSPFEALSHMAELKPDVAFLDVEMPLMNGLELAHKINAMSERTKIVFTTAHKQYALDAFHVYAFDYILKPVTPAAIERVTNRLVKECQHALPVKKEKRAASVTCFGGFEVRNPDGELVRWPTSKTEELFAYFLCHAGKDIGKWQLADMLWPDMSEERASHNLHNTMYRLKKILKEQEIGMDVLKTNAGYILETFGWEYDALAFQTFALTSEGEEREHAWAERLSSLYKGPLLENKDYSWKDGLEESCSKQYASLVGGLVRREAAEGRWSQAEQRLGAYLALYPLDEEMNRLLLDVYAQSGSTDKLTRHFARFEATYLKEMGIELPEAMKERTNALQSESRDKRT